MNTNNEISGLLTQKPDSPVPQVGGKRRFSVIEKTGKSGKKFNKIKSEGEGYGQLYEIASVQKTDFVDAHGNVSFNVKLIAAENGSAPPPAPAPSKNGNGRSPETQARIERQHSQEMAIRALAIHEGKKPTMSEDQILLKLKQLTDHFQRDIGNILAAGLEKTLKDMDMRDQGLHGGVQDEEIPF